MVSDLFGLAAPGAETPERAYVLDMAAASLQVTPTEPVWRWAEGTVYLDEKMAATPGYFDASRTPWTKEWMQIPLQPEVKEAAAMKCSQSGFTEGFLNVLRWMPKHWPGNALYSINSRDKAKEVANKRIHPTLEAAAGAQITEDPDDVTTLKISLRNMDILVAGSGSAGPFMEAWYRVIGLDELENHEQNQETTTADRARSRQATVPDGKLYLMSKPELAGGIIDLAYIRGTQEKWMVPCPRCGERIELMLSGLRFGHCKALFEWDIQRVLKETWYQCPCCAGRIDEHEKFAMVNAGVWVPTPTANRRKPPSGNTVAAEPGVRSFHISDFYSLWPSMTWGFLASLYLSAYVIDPNETRQKFFRTNHEGWPWDPKEFAVQEDTLNALVAGVEEKRGEQTVKVGTAYDLAYDENGELAARLPLKGPLFLTVAADRQADCVKYWVSAWTWDCQNFLIDIGKVKDLDALIDLRLRPYYLEGEDEPYYLGGGLVDCGDEKLEVLRACVKAWGVGFNLNPSRGSGFHSEFKGKTLFLRFDTVDEQEICIREFYDHSIKNEFYIGKIGKRTAPRLWFPRNVPASVKAELRAERLTATRINDRIQQRWVHDKQKHGPNDYGDCGKQQYVMLQEMAEALKGMRPPDPPPPV